MRHADTARTFMSLAVMATAVAVSTAGAQDTPTPKPAEVLQRAYDAAGGLDAFQRFGVLDVTIKSEEVTQDGKSKSHSKHLLVTLPGPIPGRMEIPESSVVAGDDGTGGWALVRGKPDSRPSTHVMIKRLLTTDLFPVLLPFSLTWPGVEVTGIDPLITEGIPVWRLTVHVGNSFFHSPQISPNWVIDIDRKTYAVVHAASPATDLGRGITADGMLFSWSDPIDIGGITVPQVQTITGLNEQGQEKSHSRVDRFTFARVGRAEASELFKNPIPENERPKIPIMQAPPLPSGSPQVQ